MRLLLHSLAALVIGAAGGLGFFLLHLPLPWMLGAIALCTILALNGVRLDVPNNLRLVMHCVIGVLLGSTFHSDLLDHIATWSLALLVLVIYVPVTLLTTSLYLRRVARLDRVSAFFAGAPGGLADMSAIGEAMGGDIRTIALLHSGRIFIAVFLLSFGFQYGLGYSLPGLPANVLGFPAWRDALILIACAVLGWPLARLARLPSPSMFGPMLLSAAAHVSGLTVSSPPPLLVMLAQVVFGASIGFRFAGVPLWHITRLLGHSVASTFIMLTCTIVFGAVLYAVGRSAMAANILALAPGGLTEMSLIALALGIETAFVATMHLARIVMVLIIAPLMWRVLR